ncbi:PAS domain-containing protein [Seonamhaeicola marinus]|uniref:PAS domain-containing protein n=1 Tax=Seonamhaeicola marinus TaxID=1912246 RepID=A0A5D0J7Q6_9FLAO|nr:PAS domain-containing protein [Seonamhaeicola marinus]TYA92223.1 PAS domain-containing protein [Seonamhaeicola marinus]
MKYNLSKMMGLDIYLSSLNKEEYEAVSSKIAYRGNLIMPLMSWDIHSEGYFKGLEDSDRTQDIIKVKSYAQTYSWQENIEAIFDKEVFEAIVITDLNQKIVWVNRGFSKMTGYSKNEVLNKKPSLLQGAKTSKVIKQKIKSNLKGSLPFREVITNYRKNGESYDCEVKIFPLYSKNTKTHFIALERQVG